MSDLTNIVKIRQSVFSCSNCCSCFINSVSLMGASLQEWWSPCLYCEAEQCGGFNFGQPVIRLAVYCGFITYGGPRVLCLQPAPACQGSFIPCLWLQLLIWGQVSRISTLSTSDVFIFGRLHLLQTAYYLLLQKWPVFCFSVEYLLSCLVSRCARAIPCQSIPISPAGVHGGYGFGGWKVSSLTSDMYHLST